MLSRRERAEPEATCTWSSRKNSGTAASAPPVFRGLVADVEGSPSDEPTYIRYIRRMGQDGWLGLGWPLEYGGRPGGRSIR